MNWNNITTYDEMTKLIKQFLDGEGHFTYLYLRKYIDELEHELTELKNKHAAEANANTVLGDVPNDDEIKQVATDESQKDDWMELPYRQIYAEGFVDGAIWCKKKITRHIT